MLSLLSSLTNTVTFEKLGIGPLELDRVAFTVFGINIYWYALLITGGMLLAVLFGCYYSKKVGLCPDDVMDALLCCLIPAVLGARLFYVVFRLENYFDPSGRFDFVAAINIRDGGLAIYGGIIVAFAVAVLLCHVKKISVLALFDIGALGFMIGQAIGRWGNFMNAEAYGYETDLPWGMTINGAGPFHPTFLYESLWNVVGFGLILLLAHFFKKRNGEIFLAYFTWYGAGRAVIEGLRTDSLWIFGEHHEGFNLRISQVLGIVFAVAGLTLLVLMRLGVFDKAIENARIRRENALKERAEKKQAAEEAKRAEAVQAYNPLFKDEAPEENENVSENDGEAAKDGDAH